MKNKKHFLAEQYERLFEKKLISENEYQPETLSDSYENYRILRQALISEIDGHYDFPLVMGHMDEYMLLGKYTVNSEEEVVDIIIDDIKENYESFDEFADEYSTWTGASPDPVSIANEMHYVTSSYESEEAAIEISESSVFTLNMDEEALDYYENM